MGYSIRTHIDCDCTKSGALPNLVGARTMFSVGAELQTPCTHAPILAEAMPSPHGAVFTIAIWQSLEEMKHNCRSLLHSENIRRETPVLAE